VRRHSICAAAAVVVSALLVAAPLQAQAPLSLADALALAEARSPQLASAEYAASAARERGIASAQLPDPVLRLGIDNLPVNGPDAWSTTADFMTMRRIGVMQEITDSTKRDLRRQRGEVEADRELALREATRATLRQDVATAWLDRWYAYRTAEVWRSLASELRLQYATLAAGVASGKSGAAELRAVQATLVQTDDQVAASLQQTRVAEQMLARYLGKDAARAPGAAPDMATIPFDPSMPGSLDALPQFAVLEQDNRLAQTELKLAERARRPDWSIEVAYQQRGSMYSNMISVGVNIPLAIFPADRQNRDVGAMQARLAQAETLLDDARRQRIAELAAGQEEWRSLQRRAQSLREGLLPLADDRVTQTLAAYGGGSATLAQVLEARRAAIDARMQVLLLERDAARAWAKLNYQVIASAPTARAGKEPQ
jgi:outer membrane protein TolC